MSREEIVRGERSSILFSRHAPDRYCDFCRRTDDIYAAGLSVEDMNAAIDALFDQADRAARARRMYGRRKGYHR